MLLSLATWEQIEVYLQTSRGIVIPIGSHEQHGPTGLIGTDALCPEIIAHAAAEIGGFLVAPTFNIGQAQHHLGFPGTISLRPSTMIAALQDWIASLTRHGFERLYFLNGHGGNVPSVQAAFSEAYAGYSLRGEAAPFACMLRNWWELPGVHSLSVRLYPRGLGNHATPSEVAVTYARYPDLEVLRHRTLDPPYAPEGPVRDAADYRARFPDGRIGSDPTLATAAHGQDIIAQAVRGLVPEVQAFFARG